MDHWQLLTNAPVRYSQDGCGIDNVRNQVAGQGLLSAAPATTASLTPSLARHGIDRRPTSHRAAKLARNSAHHTSSLLPNLLPLPSSSISCHFIF